MVSRLHEETNRSASIRYNKCGITAEVNSNNNVNNINSKCDSVGYSPLRIRNNTINPECSSVGYSPIRIHSNTTECENDDTHANTLANNKTAATSISPKSSWQGSQLKTEVTSINPSISSQQYTEVTSVNPQMSSYDNDNNNDTTCG